MVAGESSSRWGARVLAPLAFGTAALVLALIVYSSLNGESRGTAQPPVVTTPVTGGGATGGAGTTASGPAKKRFYRIRTGDTLESIALRFDTSVDDLLTLNPAIEPDTLAPGQRIRIR